MITLEFIVDKLVIEVRDLRHDVKVCRLINASKGAQPCTNLEDLTHNLMRV